MDLVCRSLEAPVFSVLSWQESRDPKQKVATKRCPAPRVLMGLRRVPRVATEPWREQQVWLELSLAPRVWPGAQQEQPPVSQEARRPLVARRLQLELLALAAQRPEPLASAQRRQARRAPQSALEEQAAACAQLLRPHPSRPYPQRFWLRPQPQRRPSAENVL
jgi:hypothetical protein